MAKFGLAIKPLAPHTCICMGTMSLDGQSQPRQLVVMAEFGGCILVPKETAMLLFFTLTALTFMRVPMATILLLTSKPLLIGYQIGRTLRFPMKFVGV